MSLLRAKKDLPAQSSEWIDYVLRENEPVFLSDGTPERDVVLLSYAQYAHLTELAQMHELLGSVPAGEQHPSVDVLAELAMLEEKGETDDETD